MSLKEKNKITYATGIKTIEKSSDVVKQVIKNTGFISVTDSEKFAFSNWLNK